MAEKKKKWIKKALEGAHGQFAEKAKHAGMTTREFAEKHEHSKGKLGKQARLAETLMHMHRKSSGKSLRQKMYGPHSE